MRPPKVRTKAAMPPKRRVLRLRFPRCSSSLAAASCCQAAYFSALCAVGTGGSSGGVALLVSVSME